MALDRVLGGLGDVAVAPRDFDRRLCLIADTGEATTSSAAATTLLTVSVTDVLVGLCSAKVEHMLAVYVYLCTLGIAQKYMLHSPW